jgi:hypothetical protein
MERGFIQTILSDYFEREMLNEALHRSMQEESNKKSVVNHAIRIKENKKPLPKTDTCAICLGTMRKNSNVYDLKCGHHFHIRCLDKWAKRKMECPICRDTITCEERRNV